MEFYCQCVINGREYPLGVGVSEKLARRDAAYNTFTVIMGEYNANYFGKGMDIFCLSFFVLYVYSNHILKHC